jgi:citrate lyase subunit alpha/citrate CoA-transferase
LTSNPRELLIARQAAKVIEHSGYFQRRFLAADRHRRRLAGGDRFLEDKMRRNGITASFGLGGITGTMVDLHEKG